MDAETTTQILQLIRSLRDRLGVTVIIITHEMSVVRDICDSVTLLEAGRVVQTGPVESIVSDPTSRLARDLIPLPEVDNAPLIDGKTTQLVDICFTSKPGEPTGSKVVGLVASIGADIAGGTFETIGNTQVGRLVLAVPLDRQTEAFEKLAAAGIEAEVRSND